MLRCAHFPYVCAVGLTVDHISENWKRLPSSYRSCFLCGCVVGQITEMGHIDPGDLIAAD